MAAFPSLRCSDPNSYTVESRLGLRVASALMTTAENDADPEQESQATKASAPAAETPTRLQQAGAGIAEAQAWKGQQIARGWRKLVKALRRDKEGDG
jgi:hypothetical protein